MKLKLLVAGAVGALTMSASATSILFSNGTDRIVDNAGELIRGGTAVVTAGYVDGTTFVSLADNGGGTTGTVGSLIPTLDNLLQGVWNGQTDNTTAAADAFNGRPIAVEVKVNDNEFAVFTTSAVFPANGGGIADDGEVTLSQVTGYVPDLSAPGSNYVGGFLRVGLIPEPSVSLLAGIAGLALVTRRRR